MHRTLHEHIDEKDSHLQDHHYHKNQHVDNPESLPLAVSTHKHKAEHKNTSLPVIQNQDHKKQFTSPEDSPQSDHNQVTVPVDRKYEPYEIKLASKDTPARNEVDADDGNTSVIQSLSSSTSRDSSTAVKPGNRTLPPLQIHQQAGSLNKDTSADTIPDKSSNYAGSKFQPRSSGHVHDVKKLLQRILNKNKHQPTRSYDVKQIDRNEFVQELIRQKKIRIPREVRVKKYHHRYGDYGAKTMKRMGTGRYNYGTPQDDIREAMEYVQAGRDMERINEEQKYLIDQKRIPRANIKKRQHRGGAESAIHGLEYGDIQLPQSPPPASKNNGYHADNDHDHNHNASVNMVSLGRIPTDDVSSSSKTSVDHTSQKGQQQMTNQQLNNGKPTWSEIVANSSKQSPGNKSDVPVDPEDDPTGTRTPLNDSSVSPLDTMSHALTDVAARISNQFMSWVRSSDQTEDHAE